MTPAIAPSLASTAPRARRRRPFWLLGGWLVVLAGLHLWRPAPASFALELAVEMDSSVQSISQTFFDTGKGYNEAESAAAPIPQGAAPITLTFPLPLQTLQTLRFDPLISAGTVHIRRAGIRRTDTRQTLYACDLAKVVALHDIARLSLQPNGLEIVTVPESLDSQVGLPLGEPLDTRTTSHERLLHYAKMDGSATLLALLALGLVVSFRPAVLLIRRLDRRFAAWAARLSRPEIAALDRWVFWFYGACALVFGVMAAAGLHGSSLDEYSSEFHWSDVETAPILGHPRSIRSDEWAQETPSILNQVFSARPFPVETSNCGDRNSALLFSLPCRSWLEVLRPQFWGFHFLPVSIAYALYWQARGFLLLTGVFSLLLLLTRGRSGLSALGAAWFFFSAHIQWAYSWPTMLPEMIGCFGWMICLTLYMSVGRNRWLLGAAAGGCVVSAVNFVLCFYPPHQIPFALFGAVLVPVWLWTHRAAVFRPDLVWRHGLVLAGCWTVTVLVLAGWGLEIREAMTAVVNTEYPGQRHAYGGDLSVEIFLSHFLDFWKSTDHVPATQGNICEGTGFLWLLPVTLGMRGWRGLGRPGAMLAACWAFGALLAVWMMFPVPPGIGRWLLLDHVPAGRCLPAMGLVNVAGVVVGLSLPARGDPAVPPSNFSRGGKFLAIFLGAMACLLMVNSHYHGFFQGYELLLSGGYAAGLVFCLLERWLITLTVALLVPLVWANALINPLDRGLRPITESTLYRTVQADPRLREDRWLVYSHDVSLPGFVLATGVNVFNSFKVVPDLKDMGAFDPDHRLRSFYNRGGFTIARPLPAGQPCSFDLGNPGLQIWSVSPLDPALRRAGVRFVVFDELPDAALIAQLKPVATDVPRIFIYELP